jgi:threonine/homoserine/homoserine lactone efflux protein
VTEIATGLTLGLGAGISPGPLLTLVVTSTLERGFAAGARVAMAPIVTDAPIVALAITVAAAIPAGVLAGLGVAGGTAVIALGAWTVRDARRDVPLAEDAGVRRDLWRGVVVNALSPHPWVFWFTAGGPLLVSAWRRSPALGVAFLAGFYLLLVGSKVGIAYGVARGGRRLGGAARSRLLVAGGALLIAAGVLLIWQAASGRL